MPQPLGSTCEVLCPGPSGVGVDGVGCTAWGILAAALGALGVPRPAHSRASGSHGGRGRPFPAAASPSSQPVSCLRLLLFWVRGQGRAGPAAGNRRHVHEPPRARPRHPGHNRTTRDPPLMSPTPPGPARPAPLPAQLRGIPVRVGVAPARGWCRPSPPVGREEPARIWPRCLVQGVIAGPSAPASAPGTCPRAGAGTGPVPAAPPASPAAVWGC